MDQRWEERLRLWWEDFNENLGRRWWTWPVLFAVGLAWHEVNAATVEFLSSRRGVVSHTLSVALAHIPSDPVTIAALTAIAIVGVLVFHSYAETRPKPALPTPSVDLRVLDVYPDINTKPEINYKSKLRVVLRNDTGHDLDVGRPRWVVEPGDVPFQKPFVSALQVEGSDGWEADHWQPEAGEVHVRPSQVFRTWIGLDQRFSASELRRRHESRRLGILVLPVKFDGRPTDTRQRL
jgi:hypothetical protein